MTEYKIRRDQLGNWYAVDGKGNWRTKCNKKHATGPVAAAKAMFHACEIVRIGDNMDGTATVTIRGEQG